VATTGRVDDKQRHCVVAGGEGLLPPAGRARSSRQTDLFLEFQGRNAGYRVVACADGHVKAIYQASLGTP